MKGWRLGRCLITTESLAKRWPVRVFIYKYVSIAGEEYVHIIKDILAPKGTYSDGVVKTFKDKEVFRETMSLTYQTFEHMAYNIDKLKYTPIPKVVQDIINKHKEDAVEN